MNGLDLLQRARLSDQSRFFIAFGLDMVLRTHLNAAILGATLTGSWAGAPTLKRTSILEFTA